MKEKKIQISAPEIDEIELSIYGGPPGLLCNRFTEQSLDKVLAKQMGKTVEKKFKDPEQLVRDSLYMCEDRRPGIPAYMFMRAITECASNHGIFKKTIKAAVAVCQDNIPLYGEIIPHQHQVRIANGNDIRFRALFKEWTCAIKFEYNRNLITPEMLVNLVNNAGREQGIGDWRIACSGDYGRFCVATPKLTEDVNRLRSTTRENGRG